MDVTTLGIDLSKNVFQLHGVNAVGKVVLRKRLTRIQLIEFMANLPACLVGMEASRSVRIIGHENFNLWDTRQIGDDARILMGQP